MDRRQDPRSIVTPYAFAVHPDLVGRPLATPWQRLAAISVDLVLVGLLSATVPRVLLALGSAALLLWLATRKSGRDAIGKLFKVFVGCLGLAVMMVTVLVFLAVRYGDDLEEWGGELAREAATEAGMSAEAEGIAGQLGRSGLPAPLSETPGQDPVQAAPPAEVGGEPETRMGETPLDSAREGVGPAPEVITDPIAQDSIESLVGRLALAEEERQDAEAEARRALQALEEAQKRGPLGWLLELLDEVGLGFGWGALYLTLAHAWWRGSSVGKRLFRIRVVMVDNRPLGWWLSFERAGGYAAGLATGLLGFAQVFWDPNRQAIHDKVAETVVIQDGKPPVPGPWIEEGLSLWGDRSAPVRKPRKSEGV